MFVETTTLRPGLPLLLGGGASSKILFCYYGGSVEYRGITEMGPATSSLSFFASKRISAHAYSISSSPVKNSNTSPGPSSIWIYITVLTAAEK